MMRLKIVVDSFDSNGIWKPACSVIKLNKRSCCIIGYWDEIWKYKLLWRLIVAYFDNEILIFLALGLQAVVAADILLIFIHIGHVD